MFVHLIRRGSTAILLSTLLLVAGGTVVASDAPIDGAALFDTVKSLAGHWSGNYGDGSGAMRIEVTSNGYTVLQTEFPGQHHEMRTLYWLEEGELVARHFCMLGNQPRYRVEPSADGTGLRFVFDGGSNLDPAVDPHAHEGEMRLRDDGILESSWTFWENGGPSETKSFQLTRTN